LTAHKFSDTPAGSASTPTRMVHHHHNLGDALALAKAGWKVFPCCWLDTAKAKAPLTEHGHHDATADPEQIARWWWKWPKALIGARIPESLCAVDIDPRNGGSVEALEAVCGPLPPTLTAWSGRRDGGRHLYFLRPAGGLTGSRLPAGVDLKANGYCIMPPSLHPATKRPYAWEVRSVVALPSLLRELLRPPARAPYTSTAGSQNGSGLIRKVAEAQEGNRHNALVWAAYRARHDGILDQIADELVAASVSTGESERAARATVDSVRRSQA
jgi:hypothetical protein